MKGSTCSFDYESESDDYIGSEILGKGLMLAVDEANTCGKKLLPNKITNKKAEYSVGFALADTNWLITTNQCA